MAKGINNVCQRYNGLVLFKIKPTPGDRIVLKPSHGIYQRTIPEGYYMNRKAPEKTNPVVNLFRRMYAEMKGIIEATKPEDSRPFEDTKNIKGTTIEI